MTLTLISLVAVAALTALVTAVARPRTVSAHCDTADGPATRDGRLALETGNVNHALKWIPAADEAELIDVFTSAVAIRGRDEDSRVVADRWFLENLVRIHRAGEGVAYTGIQPVGTAIDPRVTAADAAVAARSTVPLAGVVPDEQLPELERRFATVLERIDHDVDDVDAGRSYLEAYVHFFKLAEGHDHDHHHAEAHAHAHA